jgi:hypothetical protein
MADQRLWSHTVTLPYNDVWCRKLFGHLNILPLPSLCIFPILWFIIKNREFFTTNNEIHEHDTWTWYINMIHEHDTWTWYMNMIHEHDTRQVHNFYFPPANSKKYQLGVFYMGVKLYNSLPSYIKKESNNIIKFESLLKKFLLSNTFYSLDEFYNFI